MSLKLAWAMGDLIERKEGIKESKKGGKEGERKRIGHSGTYL